ncbi:bifunctional glutamate N-acetyltransferase/amino-acid acetyltransferase ArgJ [Thiolapillus sp.]|uniref:bifunctional glutamate N-acetyltransferase/amino-acid acetyltransferase ArgJ n=5 Tax=Thiolapillus sp. TaxID=2017437 RepID=UPI0025ECBB2C|nr:bifunctional glutamate N-acetyltransferase/amino-acid acetyltransferase ArgJ [Thiolapillus sp.]
MSSLPVNVVPGVRLAAVAAGIRYKERDDLVLMELAEDSVAAAVFTQNAFCAAPVTVARQHLEKISPRYLLINSGNANAGTGDTGMAASYETCRLVAAATGVAMNQVLPFSTGVIGEDLPTDPFARSIPGLLSTLRQDGWQSAAAAIMTTDTVPKLASRSFTADGQKVTVTGMCKGSGMIRPDMATMLAFVATDARIDRTSLQQVLETAVQPSFNSITVDGDTSTNDACVLVATGQSGVDVADETTPAGQAFRQAVNEVCMALARAIVLDGEGATKLVEIFVEEAQSVQQARDVAYTVAHSPLVKTALFASDPNWGRILAAVGRAGVEDLDIGQVRIWLDDVCIVSGGGRDAAYTEAAGQAVMDKDAFTIRIALAQGQASTRILTCDLSYDYVKINAEYRT